MNGSVQYVIAKVSNSPLNSSLIISGNGDVIEPEENIIAIGSGGNYALASAKALLHNSELDARGIVEKSLKIAADICVYTNENILLDEIDC